MRFGNRKKNGLALGLLFLGWIGFVVSGEFGCSPTPGDEVSGETSNTDSGASTDKVVTSDQSQVTDKTNPTDTISPPTERTNPPTERANPPTERTNPPTEKPPVSTACTGFWSDVTKTYTDAKNLKSCDGIAAAQSVVKSLMNLTNISISNNGAKLTPCVEARCDDKWVYVVSNGLPHYDFVQTTPNALKASTVFYRVAMKKEAIGSSVDAEDVGSMKGCAGAYTQYLSDPSSPTNREPSGFCTANANDKSYMTDTVDGKKVTYRKISCLGTIGFTITGVPVFGPNEGPMPDAWGNPVFFHPDKAGEPYVPEGFRGGAALDLCMGHTAQTMHYHGFYEACFERKADGSPKLSYAMATSSWDYKASLDADCTKESGIVGWSQDGVPIKGPCACTKRKADGSCETAKRVRSAYMYRGLKAWGTDPRGKTTFAKEGTTCTQLSDCCTNTKNCDYHCKYTVINDANATGGSSVGKRCVLRDYTWCVHHFTDRTKQDVSKVNFVYADRCNGYKGADGYAYHATTTFPHILGCTKFESKDALGTGAGHGGNGGGNCQRDQDCQQGQTCQQGKCQGGGSGNCQRDQDCQQGQTCQQGKCQGGGGAQSCQNDNDCKANCQGSKGCACRNNAQSQKICAPLCSTNADCPAGGPATFICGREGHCIPKR